MNRKILKTFSILGDPYMNEFKYRNTPIKKHLHVMTPDHYIQLSAELLNMTFDQVVNTRLKDHSSYSYIERAAKKGLLTIPVLDYKDKVQNGLHRAMWCKEQGFKKIPVLIYK